MPDDPRVQLLIEEILESGRSAEEVCRVSPELLPQVQEGWRKFQAVRAQIGVLFPETEKFQGQSSETPSPSAGDWPEFPGYEIEALLGQGGMGAVYLARQSRLIRLVALKVMLAGAYAGRDERGRFQREAEAVAGLQHPNVVQIYDVGESAGRPYFTMEFLEGGSLARQSAGTPQPGRRAAELLETLARAVQFAHHRGIVHRDLKPSNVLLAADGTPKLSDFGLARRLDGGAGLTRSGLIIGTPSYMAPEQARGDTQAVGTAVDIYALGAILYELLTGRPPFRSETAAETVRQVIDQDPAPPSRLNAKVPRDLETICLKCLHKEPTLRYADAASLAEDLRRFLRGEAISARPEGRLSRLARRVRRRPALSAAIAGGSLVTAILAGGGLWLIMERSETSRRSEAQRVATEEAAEADLREMARLEEESSWSAAAAALERAKGRLGRRGSSELLARLEQGARDLELAAHLDAIRLNRARIIGETWDLSKKRSNEEFEAAFRKAGLGRDDESPAVVASRVTASNITEALVDALDDWVGCVDPPRQDWLMDVARRVDRDSPPWRALARDPKTWQDKATLIKLVADAPVAERSVPLLLALALRLTATGVDSVPFLKRIQQAHPDDFWVNSTLANVLLQKKRAGEAIGYYHAALAVRPESSVNSNNLGQALSAVGRLEEANTYLRQAAKLEPTTGVVQYNLALNLTHLKRYAEAIDQIRLALRLVPESATMHCSLGYCLDGVDRRDEAEGEYRQAMRLDPTQWQARRGVRNCLVRRGRLDEARLEWETAIALDPPEHEAWDGYAELCLFLGRDAEYRRASKALIRRFEGTLEAPIAERTGRACLLMPIPEAEAAEAAALIDQALASQNQKNRTWSYPYYLFSRGLAYYRLGRLEDSIAILNGEASRVLVPAPQLVLAMAQHRKGHTDEARKTLAAAVLAFDWRASLATNREAWIYHVLRREAERMILPDLTYFLEGRHQPRDNDERFALTGACQFANRPELVASLYADAFLEAPQLGEDRSGLRYKAARAAALAGRDEANATGEEERPRWRRQARQWLRAELNAWSKALDGDPTKFRDPCRGVLNGWYGEPDLSCLRDQAELDKLPGDERVDCIELWAQANALLDRVENVICTHEKSNVP